MLKLATARQTVAMGMFSLAVFFMSIPWKHVHKPHLTHMQQEFIASFNHKK